MKYKIKEEDLDQVSAYARDLREYHYQSRDKNVVPILVLTKTKNLYEEINGIICVSDDLLQNTLDDIYTENINPELLETWINSKYEPLPTIVEAFDNLLVFTYPDPPPPPPFVAELPCPPPPPP